MEEMDVMIFNLSAGAAQIAVGVGLLTLICGFIPARGGRSKELNFGPISLAIYRPVVFASGALLCGFGSIASGVLSLIERLASGV
jgi:hypothetical protein